MGVYFVACTLCMICLLHKGRSGADQCDQDTRPASIVKKDLEKIRIQIVESMKIRSYIMKTLPIASKKSPKSLLASTTMKIDYR